MENQKEDRQLEVEPIKEKKEDRQLDALREQLSNVGAGYQIRITRIEPSWCAGELETIPILDAASPIGLDAIIERWGGFCLRLKIHDESGRIKGGGTVWARTWPPKRRGEIITEHGLLYPKPPQEALTPPNYAPPSAPATQQQSNFLGGLDLKYLIDMALGGKKGGGGGDGAIAGKLLEHALTLQQQAMQQAAAPQINVTSQFEQVFGMFELFKKYGSMFGNDAGGGGGLEGMVGNLMQMYMTNQQQKQKHPPKPPERPRIIVPPPTPPVPAPTQLGQPERDLDGIINDLASLTPDEASDAAVISIGKMSARDAKDTIRMMMEKMTDDQSLDESAIQDDTNSQDEYDFDQSEIPNTNSQTPPDGRPISPDARDNSPDR